MLLGLLILGASVVVRIEPTDDVPEETQLSLARALVSAIEANTGRAATLDDPSWPSCGQSPSCVAEIAKRAKSDEVIFLRMVASATLLRAVLKQVQLDGSVATQQVDLAASGEAWDQGLGKVAVQLLGAGKRFLRDPLAEAAPPTARGPPILPLGLLIGGVASIGAGVALGVSSALVQSRYDSRVTPGTELESARGEKSAEAWGANILFLAGGAAILGGIGAWMLGD